MVAGSPPPPLQLDDPVAGYLREQARLQEVRDRLGPLFMDLKGGRGARLAAGWAGLVCMAARGALLGTFAGERRRLGPCGSVPSGAVASPLLLPEVAHATPASKQVL
jgi:hypothetical protein